MWQARQRATAGEEDLRAGTPAGGTAAASAWGSPRTVLRREGTGRGEVPIREEGEGHRTRTVREEAAEGSPGEAEGIEEDREATEVQGVLGQTSARATEERSADVELTTVTGTADRTHAHDGRVIRHSGRSSWRLLDSEVLDVLGPRKRDDRPRRQGQDEDGVGRSAKSDLGLALEL